MSAGGLEWVGTMVVGVVTVVGVAALGAYGLGFFSSPPQHAQKGAEDRVGEDMLRRGVWVVGLMSGTSRDGVSVAFLETDGERVLRFGARETFPYDERFRERLAHACATGRATEDLVRELTDAHSEAVKSLLFEAWDEDVHGPTPAIVGFHGHTIRHDPARGVTVQIGDAARLSRSLGGVRVVYDFRSADVARGGQGAPLVPVFHRALARDLAGVRLPVAVLNLGGVSNVTWVGRGEADMLAFDCGPGVAFLDDWVLAKTEGGMRFDRSGSMAAAGESDEDAVARFLRHEYFARKPPKSLDRDQLALHVWSALAAAAAAVPEAGGDDAAAQTRRARDAAMRRLELEDGCATLAAFTAAAIAKAAEHFPEPAAEWLVAGGGRHHLHLMDEIRVRASAGAKVRMIDDLGIDGDAIEAYAFAFLAVRSLRNLPLSFPGTTGVPDPAGCTGGRWIEAATASRGAAAMSSSSSRSAAADADADAVPAIPDPDHEQ
jgi:anhydro-N-acetylmuramic acid kinase